MAKPSDKKKDNKNKRRLSNNQLKKYAAFIHARRNP